MSKDQRPSGATRARGRLPLPDGIRIRTFTLRDYREVLALWKSSEGVGLNESDTRSAIAAYLRRNPRLSLVACDRQGSVIGAVLCGHDGRRGYLHHLAVAPAQRRKGVGQALVERCLGRLRTLGVPKCNIFLYANNASGRAFWLRQGWKAREDLVVVQRPLS